MSGDAGIGPGAGPSAGPDAGADADRGPDPDQDLDPERGTDQAPGPGADPGAASTAHPPTDTPPGPDPGPDPGVDPPATGRAHHAPAPVRISRRPWVAAGVFALVAVALVGVVIVYDRAREPFDFESALMTMLAANRAPWLTAPALVLDRIGSGLLSGLVVPALVIGALLVWRRPWAALFFLVAVLASSGLTRLVKLLVGRVRPEDILVHPDFGSFPSGHSSNAAVIATALGLIFMRTWVWVAGAVYTVLMMLSRMYLGAHWLSDTVAGLLIGAGAALIVWAPFAYRLYREHRLPHPPIWRKVEAERAPTA
ncbi:phosphatase PAP2 family protein [Agromyces aurantiacus]|uniref:Phosphatase PAP2 family protein n=1 Tax=Agromyces aurantiacus TaxID=165814 RepID=A0ABV9R2C7_9MICO|nr:phosphatase PAP2 family protein [Agromyces aurantiacus]MBM7502819.1 undecaprenyl-diphosphatase [Agromyces aurantiacus]